jgi:ABC-type transport system involved in multi-copper enzyme maturation permease subunit
MSRARAGAYALWQLRDYFKDRGLPTLIVGTLAAYLSLSDILASDAREQVMGVLRARFVTPEAVDAAWRTYVDVTFVTGILGALVFLGALFAMNGIVANDRKFGFYRFLFAKPVTPARYYGQAFVLHWAGFMAVVAVLGGLYGIVMQPVLTKPLLLVVALMFVAYAGIAFLLSAAARWDWLSLVVVSIAADVLWTRFGASVHPLAKLLYLLPPLHRARDLYAAAAGAPMPFAAPSEISWPLLAWLVGYGALCYLAGLIVLRYRRLAIV